MSELKFSVCVCVWGGGLTQTMSELPRTDKQTQIQGQTNISSRLAQHPKQP